MTDSETYSAGTGGTLVVAVTSTTDYETDGHSYRKAHGYTIGSMRTGGPNPYTWIGHPREGLSSNPRQPPFAISGTPWADDLAAWQALETAGKYRECMDYLLRNNFSAQTTDLVDATALKAWLAANPAQRYREICDDTGGAWGF